MAAEPGIQILGPLEVEQGNREGLERTQRERLDAGLLAGGQGAAAVLEQAEGKGDGFGLAAFFMALLTAFQTAFLKALKSAFLLALLKAQAKDLAVGHAAAEVVDGDPTHDADLGNGAAAEA